MSKHWCFSLNPNNCWLPHLYSHFSTLDFSVSVSCYAPIVHSQTDGWFAWTVCSMIHSIGLLLRCFNVQNISTLLRLIPYLHPAYFWPDEKIWDKSHAALHLWTKLLKISRRPAPHVINNFSYRTSWKQYHPHGVWPIPWCIQLNIGLL